MRKIIVIAAAIVAVATFSASANPYDAGNFPNNYGSHGHHRSGR